MNQAEAKILSFPVNYLSSTGTSSHASEYLKNAIYTEITNTLKESLLSELMNVMSEAIKGNFDHYGAIPTNIFTYEEVRKFLILFPFEQFPFRPDILIEPDGSLELDWELENSSFTISFSGTSKVYYSALFSDGSRSRGMENFDGIWIPEDFFRFIQRVYKVSKKRNY